MAGHETPSVSPPLRVIIGPTAAGKSAIAMELAKRFDLALVSADSRQVYRGFDIGTAKPSLLERAEVQHFGIDVQDPRDRYSAHAWAVDSIGWMQQARAAGKNSLVVGGTGFYVRALVRPLAPSPMLHVGRRDALAQWLGSQSFDELRRWCQRLDPLRAHLGRTQLERAIETALLAGTRLGDLHARQKGDPALVPGATEALPVRYLVVDPGASLADRIRTRIHRMLDEGWVEEIKKLLTHVPSNAPAWLASGYDVMRRHAAGEFDRATAISNVIIETRQYAKRQRTWYRHQLSDGPVTTISPLDATALDTAIAWWNGTETRA